MKKEAPARKVFWLIYLGLALVLYSQKEARSLAMELRPSSIQPSSGSGDQVIALPQEVFISWEKREGDTPSHYKFEKSINCTAWDNLDYRPENVQEQDGRYFYFVGNKDSLGSKFFVRSVYEE